jgi:hypothetical protein
MLKPLVDKTELEAARETQGSSVLAPMAPPTTTADGKYQVQALVEVDPFAQPEGEQVAQSGGPLRILANTWRAARRTLDPSQARTINEIIPDSALDEMYDAVTNPNGPTNPFRVGGFNLDNIDAEIDVKNSIDKVAELYGERAQAVGRNVVTNETTRELAQSLSRDMGDEGLARMLLERESGGTFNAHQMLAARNLYNRTMEDIVQVAQAVIENGGAQDVQRFRHRLALATAMHSQLKGAQAEAARALQSFRIASVGGPAPAAAAAQGSPQVSGVLANEAVQQVTQQTGGVGAAQTAARAILTAAAQGNHTGLVSQTVRAVQGKDTVDAVIEGWLGGLVSSPDTWALAFAGNAMVAGVRNVEHLVAGVSGTIFSRDLRNLADPLLFTFGQLQGALTGMQLAGKTLIHGDAGLATKFTDGTIEPAIAGKTFRDQRIPFANSHTLGSVYQAAAEGAGRLPGGQLMEPAMLYGSGATGRLVDFAGEYYFRIPFRVLSAEDQMFRSISYTGELYAGAYRYARENAAAQNKTVKELYNEALADPENVMPDIHMQSLAQAREDVMQNPGHDGLFGFLQTAANSPTGRIMVKPIFPFMRVINNSMQWSYDRMPLLPQVIDAVRTPGPDNRWNTVIGQNGGPARDQEIAKMVTGSTLLATGWFMAQGGNFNGNVGEGQSFQVRAGARLMGLQGNSVVFRNEDGSDTQYDINRMDPASMLFLVGAMTNEAIALSESESERNSVVLTATLAVRDILSDKSALSTMEDVLKVWGSPENTFDEKLNRFIATRVSSLVPSYMGKIKRENDETPYYQQAGASNPYDTQWLRLLNEIHNRSVNRLPSAVSKAMGLEPHESLPDHVNMFGEEWERPAGFPLEWASFVATTKPRFSREQLNKVLPKHLHDTMDLRTIRLNRDISVDELAVLVASVGPHGELQRLGMPVGKRKRQWKGVKLPPIMDAYIHQLEGQRVYQAIFGLITSREYLEASEQDDIDYSKQMLLRETVRDVRQAVDDELWTDPFWTDIANAARVKQDVGETGMAPFDTAIPDTPPGSPIAPDAAVNKLLEGQF